MKIKIQIEIEVDSDDVQYPMEFIEPDQNEDDYETCSFNQLDVKQNQNRVSKNFLVRGSSRKMIKRRVVEPDVIAKIEGDMGNKFSIKGEIPGLGFVHFYSFA